MRYPAIASLAAGLLLLGACSSDEAAQSSEPSSGSDNKTSLSINTDDGSVSYKDSDGDSSTSISVSDGDKNKKD